MRTAKMLIVFLFSISILSCSKDDDTREDNVNDQPIEYSFVKIEFFNTDQSEISDQYVNIPSIIYVNKTSVTQSFPYNPLTGVYETSQFLGFETSVVNHIVNAPVIAVPINIENSIYLGEAKWTISNNIEKKQTNLVIEHSISIESNQKKTIKTNLHYKRLSTNVKLTLVDNRDNKEHVFEGKWIGVFPINATIEFTFTNL